MALLGAEGADVHAVDMSVILAVLDLLDVICRDTRTKDNLVESDESGPCNFAQQRPSQ